MAVVFMAGAVGRCGKTPLDVVGLFVRNLSRLRWLVAFSLGECACVSDHNKYPAQVFISNGRASTGSKQVFDDV